MDVMLGALAADPTTGAPPGQSLPEVVAAEERRRWVRFPVALAGGALMGAIAVSAAERSIKRGAVKGAVYGGAAAVGWAALTMLLAAVTASSSSSSGGG